MFNVRAQIAAVSIAGLPDYFEFYHAALNGVESRGVLLTVDKTRETVGEVLGSIVRTHESFNPARRVTQVRVDEKEIASFVEGVLTPREEIGDLLFAKAFLFYGGRENDLCVYSSLSS